MKKLDIESEVRDLAARRDIYDAICNYMRGQDRLLPEVQRRAFHDDAFVDCGLYAGSADGFVNFAQGLLAGFKQSQHLIGQAHIQIEGNVAHGEIYFLAQHRIVEGGMEKDLFVAGRYIDRYEDRGGGWKIAKRRELVDWARTDAASDAFLKEQSALILGARGHADFSCVRAWP
jgi:SnoaL-like domain